MGRYRKSFRDRSVHFGFVMPLKLTNLIDIMVACSVVVNKRDERFRKDWLPHTRNHFIRFCIWYVMDELLGGDSGRLLGDSSTRDFKERILDDLREIVLVAQRENEEDLGFDLDEDN